ncbi:bile acid:sodium symporter family protein [Branchiibius cervicis]|uniref:Bile acid:sodium symporter family protein n=1 Tax=Branchiibius cervicis TaxID=908252 RepID=A0ABW2ASV0_9MICO
MGWLKKIGIDGFVLSILLTVVVASIFPASGSFAPTLDKIVAIAIGLLFFLYGARLHPREALEGLAHWRLHLLILCFTFVVFPLVGVAMRALSPWLLSAPLYTGVLYLTLVPSTVQSSIAFTSIARGNVAGAIVSASASNLLGVFLTPLLVVVMVAAGLMGVDGDISITGSAVLDIVVQLLLPFVLGMLARPLIGGWVKKNASWLKYVDRCSILLVVYSAFSEGVREGIWSKVAVWQIIVLVVLSVLLVLFMLWLTRWSALRLGFNRADMIAIQFCGTKKSLASGLPMAAVLFSAGTVGLIVLPLMIFHQVQLMMCSWLAGRYASEPVATPSAR